MAFKKLDIFSILSYYYALLYYLVLNKPIEEKGYFSSKAISITPNISWFVGKSDIIVFWKK